MCRSYGDQFEILLKDKRDISSYLKKQLELRNGQVFDLNDRLVGLQKAKDQEKELYEKNFQDLKEKSQKEIDKLENENFLLSNTQSHIHLPIISSNFINLETRLISVEEFKTQRQTMETTIEELKRQIQQKEDAYRSALDQMEIALITFKNRLKKEAIQYLNDLAIEFRRTTKNQISQTIQRAIRENFYLNNQITHLTTQLEKSIEMNKKSTEKNQHLTRTVSILQDVELQTTNKIFATENIIRMLCQQLKERKERKMSADKVIVAKEDKSTEIVSEEETSMEKQEDSTELKNLKEENNLLRNIIDRAAKIISDVVQSDETSDLLLKTTKRSEMLEELLSILLTSHHLGRTELLFEEKSKGIYPATRLNLHRIRPNIHYHLGDLGLVPSH
ncbi:unnamed protein product [Adineta ricciae]|uniref:Cilia- and flagella-associated protein 157 n=1 Tax=Adineta ricciae TaxID=249248 RepID=A0A815XTM7_ADIRI|nr:unnamed protein product [Adineta ricciae]